MQDDYLDVYGDEKVFGKAIGGDITSNKKTYMLINAFLRADASQRQELEHWMEMEDFDRQEKVSAVTTLYDALHIDELAKEKINQYFKESKAYLDAVSVAEDRKKELRAYADRMMRRNK